MDLESAVVGTVNMDFRSLYLHYEDGVYLYNADAIAQVAEDFTDTLPLCREIHLSDCHTNLPGTVLDSALRLLSPLM